MSYKPQTSTANNYFSYFCITPSRVPCFTVTAEAAGKTMTCSADTQGSRPDRSGSGLVGRCQRQDVNACPPVVTDAKYDPDKSSYFIYLWRRLGTAECKRLKESLSPVLVQDCLCMYDSPGWTSPDTWTFQPLSSS